MIGPLSPAQYQRKAKFPVVGMDKGPNGPIWGYFSPKKFLSKNPATTPQLALRVFFGLRISKILPFWAAWGGPKMVPRGVLRHDARHDKYGPHSLLDTTLPLQDTTVSWPGMTKTTKKRPRPTGWNGVVISVAVIFWQFADLDLETSLEWASPASASLEVHLLRELPSREFELP